MEARSDVCSDNRDSVGEAESRQLCFQSPNLWLKITGLGDLLSAHRCCGEVACVWGMEQAKWNAEKGQRAQERGYLTQCLLILIY